MSMTALLKNLFPSARQTRRAVSRKRSALSVQRLESRDVPSSGTDSLYIGENHGNTVERFNAATGEHLGTFVENSQSLKGPRGLLFDNAGHLILANQNTGRGKPGEIKRYDAPTGAFDDELVPFQSPNAPFAPRGIVLKDNVLYVGSLQNSGSPNAAIAPDGEIMRYNATTGAYLGSFTRPAGYAGQFNPRGVVFGPDGYLYVGVLDSSNQAAGHVLRYDVTTGTSTVFATNDGDGIAEPGETPTLHRPEGLVVGPDGRLYVSSFRADASDIDRILMFYRPTGALSDTIELYQPGQPRAFAVAFVFGPGDDLFVPIDTADPNIGSVRRYDVATKTYTEFVAPGTLGTPAYLTFGNTNPATLAYEPAAAAPTMMSNQVGQIPNALLGLGITGQRAQVTFDNAHGEEDRNQFGYPAWSYGFVP